MKDKISKLALTVSLLFNAVFIGKFIYDKKNEPYYLSSSDLQKAINSTYIETDMKLKLIQESFIILMDSPNSNKSYMILLLDTGKNHVLQVKELPDKFTTISQNQDNPFEIILSSEKELSNSLIFDGSNYGEQEIKSTEYVKTSKSSEIIEERDLFKVLGKYIRSNVSYGVYFSDIPTIEIEGNKYSMIDLMSFYLLISST